MADLPAYLTPAETAERLRLSPGQVGRLLAAGLLPGIRIGQGRGVWRVPMDQLIEWERSRSNRPLPAAPRVRRARRDAVPNYFAGSGASKGVK